MTKQVNYDLKKQVNYDLNKQVNYDLKNLNNWLSANKICLNVGKTKVVLFKSLKKQTDSDLHIKLNGK